MQKQSAYSYRDMQKSGKPAVRVMSTHENMPKSVMKRPTAEGKKVNTFFKKAIGFDQENIQTTLHMPIERREYGFMRTAKSSTPYFGMKTILDSKELSERLLAEKNKIDLGLEKEPLVVGTVRSPEKDTLTSSSGSSASSRHTRADSQLHGTTLGSFDDLPFELKRKKFDEAEYTIARGKKMSDVYHGDAARDFEIGANRDSQHMAFQEMEAFCRTMNIKISQGSAF
ncbi:uncharacterized protein LOC115624236 [Scaptodrosophila lebanonensis]|uniref:Uncharacterized protein LOC115624236 n=1 Tax=Drosophila lebanonensis TaxID=7225 RepID=A0A6J2TI68_DROLE|nr:uncharacterized protein LOC115624236 [Scaptodrosophila lebanonensis]